ncbi:MAG: dihydroorotate dehydrogenase electron transfer subunit [Acetobacter sp.]|nr:dihydroorotate dehydrogenase electron transfer subunit [Bacteroides sp.]MCM1340661.1 dihydroorotate dehydrogenase electron transfer subunit [Acetobacter sp.]MCM1433772.1 dihydroorotate dehydrogenase electron transfer subunit [Clostridiales bacterium]
MYKQNVYKILSNVKLAKDVYKMILEGDTQYITAPGQFINIKLEGKFLRRPISVCDYDENTITIIYKVVGSGTEYMSELSAGSELDVLTGLGNGYDISNSKNPLVIGGGVGVPPMYNLTKKLIEDGQKVTVILGFNTKDEIFYEQEFKALGAEVIVTTVDGSYGIKGFVTDAFPQSYDYFYTCGPMPMFKAIEAKAVTSGQYSFEERMGCGFGACMGCSCKTKYGNKRICKDGPVLVREEIIW